MQRLPLDLELNDLSFELIDLLRQRIDLDAQPRSRFVNQINGLVGQETIGDVAIGKRGRGDNRRVLDADAVMNFVFLFQSAQDGDRIFDGRFANIDLLKASFQRGILFDVFLVFVKRGRAHTAQFAAGQRGLQHVRSIDGAFGRAGADQRVKLVNEKNDLTLGAFNLFQNRLQTIFKLATVFGAGEHRSQIETHQSFVAQRLRHVAGNDPLRQAFDDRGLAHAGLTDKHGIVFGAPGKDLNGAPYFVVAADDRIEFAFARQIGEIARVL